MYFPIIRGRQYDLLALRELKSSGLLSNKIIPIIEPIKMSSTLNSIIHLFREDHSQLVIIVNPKVGSFMGDLDSPTIKAQFHAMLNEENVTPAYYFSENAEAEIKEITTEFDIELNDLVIIHSERNLVPLYQRIFEGVFPMYNAIPFSNSFRRPLYGQNLVGYADKFNKLLRNADYLDRIDEFYSDDHIYYKDDDYIGFSDYSTVGADYNEGGFAPYAVAFHIVYFDLEKNLNIMHFVSETNNDISDPANKFSEALEKFVLWYRDFEHFKVETRAIKILLEHHRNGTYPGLPTLKKLSIMHHLELIGTYLESGGE